MICILHVFYATTLSSLKVNRVYNNFSTFYYNFVNELPLLEGGV
jgi:hypothetical protein